MGEDIEDVLLAITVAAFLIRTGGRTVFTPDEWEAATERASSMYIHRDGPDRPVQVFLMPKEAGHA
jgi:hypothetical protein